MSEKPVLELQKITHWFGDKLVLSDISFAVEKGQFLCILGPSGSGKTTLLNIIAGLVHPTRGQIKISGADVTKGGLGERRIGYVFQEPDSLLPHLNVQDNIAFPLRHGKFKDSANARQRSNELLDMLGMKGKAKSRIDTLSGGEKQRVAIARCLAYKPDLILFDEPLRSLDNALKEDVLAYLSQLHEGVDAPTFVYVTHDEREAMQLASTLAVLHDGYIEQFGDTKYVVENPSTVISARLLGDWNVLQVGRADEGKWAEKLRQKLPGPSQQACAFAFRVQNTLLNQPSNSRSFIELSCEIIDSFSWYGEVRTRVRLGDQSVLITTGTPSDSQGPTSIYIDVECVKPLKV